MHTVLKHTESVLIELSDGLPQDGYAKKGAFSYYKITPGAGHQDVTVTLTSTSGSESLFISTKQLPELDAETYEWHMGPQEAVKSVVIAEDAKGAEEGGDSGESEESEEGEEREEGEDGEDATDPEGT